VSIHLMGGGRDAARGAEVWAGFVAEATERAESAGREAPRISVVLVGEGLDPDWYRERLTAGGACEPTVTVVPTGQTLNATAFLDADALLIGGGHTPSYLDAVLPAVDQIRLLVADGLPYLGFSAGAMIVADRALVGGWRIGGVEVCAEQASEDLDELTLVAGIGLVDLAVDVHAAQWGTLSRLVAATEAGLVDGGVAIDEHTALVIGDGGLTVVGDGSVWKVTAHQDGVLVGTLGA